VALCACFLAIFPGPAALYDLLAEPILRSLPTGSSLIATSVISPFTIPLKTLLIASIFCAIPAILWHAWSFASPGLYAHERHLLLPLVISCSLLFFAGVCFCYFFVFSQVFSFIQGFSPKSVVAAPDIESYFDFALAMLFAFGTGFELPLVVVLLTRLGVFTLSSLRAFRSYFLLISFIFAAIITPPDVVSQLALALPMTLLYELGLFAARFTPPPPEPDHDLSA
jgi:sec-independent protein translocase protein TatC